MPAVPEQSVLPSINRPNLRLSSYHSCCGLPESVILIDSILFIRCCIVVTAIDLKELITSCRVVDAGGL